MNTFICYPKCSTCKKAQKYLDVANVDYTIRHIVEDKLSADEIKDLKEKSGLPLKRFFNTSGMLYRELDLKNKLKDMSEEEQYALLSTNGMLVKRPILVTEDKVLVGFKQKEYDETIK